MRVLAPVKYAPNPKHRGRCRCGAEIECESEETTWRMLGGYRKLEMVRCSYCPVCGNRQVVMRPV